jgi:isopropylmalate/homocitrate/citramalate synthase
MSCKLRPAALRSPPAVGGGLFGVEPGIVVHVMRQTGQTGLGEHAPSPCAPRTVGHDRYAIVAGRGSGQNSTAIFLEEWGIEATPERVAEIAHRIEHAGPMLKNGLAGAALDAVIEDVTGRS